MTHLFGMIYSKSENSIYWVEIFVLEMGVRPDSRKISGYISNLSV